MQNTPPVSPSNVEPPSISTRMLNTAPDKILPVPEARPRGKTGQKKNSNNYRYTPQEHA